MSPAPSLSPRVAFARARAAAYDEPGSPWEPTVRGEPRSVAFEAVTAALEHLGLDAEHRGTAEWNPLGELVQPGQRVVLKPNWVLHESTNGSPISCLVTHSSMLEALLVYLERAHPGRVTLGDAPLQGCDLPELRRRARIDQLADTYRRRGLPVEVQDFRNRVLREEGLTTEVEAQGARQGRSLLFDLGSESLLEPIAADADRFRVTRYDPSRMKLSHRAGVHKYCIAREVIEADVIFNVPKLKTHMKACVTGALKNLVGINGDKDFLPHHRKGGSALGGDCYRGFGLMRHVEEELYDLANRNERNKALSAGLLLPVRLIKKAGDVLGFDTEVEGAWFGNDTIWRTCLDLQRVLRYGRVDGTLAREPQRTVLSITDAIMAGEGEGPLAPEPVAAGFVTAGLSTVAVEWVNTRLMGFDPRHIPLLREAMELGGPQGLVTFGPADVEVRGYPHGTSLADLKAALGRPFRAPRGWRGFVELGA